MFKNALAIFGGVCGLGLTFIVGWAMGITQEQTNPGFANKIDEVGDAMFKFVSED